MSQRERFEFDGVENLAPPPSLSDSAVTGLFVLGSTTEMLMQWSGVGQPAVTGAQGLLRERSEVQ